MTIASFFECMMPVRRRLWSGLRKGSVASSSVSCSRSDETSSISSWGAWMKTGRRFRGDEYCVCGVFASFFVLCVEPNVKRGVGANCVEGVVVGRKEDDLKFEAFVLLVEAGCFAGVYDCVSVRTPYFKMTSLRSWAPLRGACKRTPTF